MFPTVPAADVANFGCFTCFYLSQREGESERCLPSAKKYAVHLNFTFFFRFLDKISLFSLYIMVVVIVCCSVVVFGALAESLLNSFFRGYILCITLYLMEYLQQPLKRYLNISFDYLN